jgi:hypothetical protein
MPIPGFDTFNVANLRLWASKPSQEFDLGAFNMGNYVEAINARQRAEQISSVLYPNDNSTQGKLGCAVWVSPLCCWILTLYLLFLTVRQGIASEAAVFLRVRNLARHFEKIQKGSKTLV